MFKNRKRLVSISQREKNPKPVTHRCFVKKNCRIHRKTPELEPFLNLVTDLRCFHVNFVKFLETAVF